VVVTHPNKDLGKGLVHAIYKGADGHAIECHDTLHSHY
jgi:hypothetical protein